MTLTVSDLPADTWRALDDAAKMRLRWRLQARPAQLTPPMHYLCSDPDLCPALIAEAHRRWPLDPEHREMWLADRGHFDWQVWLMLAGRGYGKTRSGAEDIAKYMLERPRCRVALVAATFADGRDTMVEGESGLLAVIPVSELRGGSVDRAWNRSTGELRLRNGARAKVFSAEKPERLRGPQHHRAWADELAAWTYLKATWDQLMFGLRLEYRPGEVPQVVVTTTPKPLKFLRKKLKESETPAGGVIVVRGSTRENVANLARFTVKRLLGTYEGTRIGRQELDAEILEDYEGGVVRQSDIDKGRREWWECPDLEELLQRVVVAVDPAVSAKRTSDETGVVAAGISAGACPVCTREQNPRGQRHGFILQDATPGRVTDHEWAAVAARTYRRWHADRVVAEVNNGGDLVESVLTAAAVNLPVKQVRASRGKVVRAEPVGALFERGAVHVMGHMARLEDQLCSLGVEVEDDNSDVDPETGEDESDSPDRADAAVWALTELFGLDESVTVVGQATDDRGGSSR